MASALATAADAAPSSPAYDPHRLTPPPGVESHRIWIHNVAGGEVLGSKDQGKTWTTLGHVVSPILGGIWRPTQQGGVYAFNYLRGDSNVFGSAINALHLRFSDPEGYQLPADLDAPLVPPHAVSIMPMDSVTSSASDEDSTRVAVTDMLPSEGIFGPEWSPHVGSKVLIGDGVSFHPISYEVGPDARISDRSYLQIIVEKSNPAIEYLEFDNFAQGKVMLKRQGEEPVQVAKVLQPVEGVGRFEGSEFVKKLGTVRANHAGVICIGTTDVSFDPEVQKPIPAAKVHSYRGGFQIIASHHYQDHSMNSGGDHPFVYMVVGPIQDPPNLKRYDMGIEGSYPLYFQGLRAGRGQTLFKFRGEQDWVEISDAVAQGRFKEPSGAVIKHLRGVKKTALKDVVGIRILSTE